MKKNKSYLGKIKEAVDFIYRLVIDTEDGYRAGFSSYDNLVKRVVTALFKRGVLSRECHSGNGKPGRGYIYKWGANMSPTDNLYKVILGDIRADKKRQNARRYQKIKNNVTPVSVSVESTKPYCTIDRFSSQELWDELKRRGYSPDGDRLVKKDYLD